MHLKCSNFLFLTEYQEVNFAENEPAIGVILQQAVTSLQLNFLLQHNIQKQSKYIYSPPVLATDSRAIVCFWVGAKIRACESGVDHRWDSKTCLYHNIKRFQGGILWNGAWWSVLLNCSNCPWYSSNLGPKKYFPKLTLDTYWELDWSGSQSK